MTEKRSFVLTLLLGGLLVVLMTLFTGCGQAEAADKKEEKKEEAVPVEVTTVTKGSVSAYFTGTATLEAESEAQVVAKVSGVVEKILVEEGDKVKEGQILAQLDDRQLTLTLKQEEARLKKFANDFKRNEELFNKKIISAELYERVKADYQMQEATVENARLLKNYAAIKAPISGVVAQRMIKRGNMVALNAPCFHIADFDPLLAVLHVPEKEMNKLKKDQAAKLTVDARPGETFNGKILRISPVVDSGTSTFKVTVAVSDKEGNLKHGMFGRINIVYDVHEDTLLLPKDAVLTEGNESVVFVVKDNKANRKIIDVGYVNTTHLEVKTGVALGDKVVQTGMSGLKDGTTVEILETKTEPSADQSSQ